MSKTRTNPLAVLVVGFIVVAALYVGYNAVMDLPGGGRAEDTVEKWAAPKRMTKPKTSDRAGHTVKFIVEGLPARALNVHAKAGVGQSYGPATIEAGRWSWTAHNVRTGEFAELNVEEASKESGATRCWITVDGKLYRDAGRDTPYDVVKTGGQCWARVVVG